jgi:citrate synthase
MLAVKGLCMYTQRRERVARDAKAVTLICRSYDPAFQNTAVVTSRITFIDGEKGILRYRGYVLIISLMNEKT